MAGFFKKMFGGSKATTDSDSPVDLIEDVLDQLIQTANFNLSFDIKEEDGTLNIDIYGDDEELLLARDGQLLDAFQLFLKRVAQHQVPEERLNIQVDSDGYREEANQSLIDLADKLKGIALSKSKPVYFRALPPRDRKVIHQYLAEDGRVKSRSIGDGLYKKIKIYPTKGDRPREEATEHASL